MCWKRISSNFSFFSPIGCETRHVGMHGTGRTWGTVCPRPIPHERISRQARGEFNFRDVMDFRCNVLLSSLFSRQVDGGEHTRWILSDGRLRLGGRGRLGLLAGSGQGPHPGSRIRPSDCHPRECSGGCQCSKMCSLHRPSDRQIWALQRI